MTEKKPITLWLTGLSGSGKTTLANHLLEHFWPNWVIIDGDEIRKTICSDLGYTESDRMTNVVRAAEACRKINLEGKNVIAALTSPLEEHRTVANIIIQNGGFSSDGEMRSHRFVLGFVDEPIETVRDRDSKGLYKAFDEGKIKNMVGCDLPFENPIECSKGLFELIHLPPGTTPNQRAWIIHDYFVLTNSK